MKNSWTPDNKAEGRESWRRMKMKRRGMGWVRRGERGRGRVVADFLPEGKSGERNP